MDTNAYVSFLIIGALLVVIDGMLIYRSGRKYLAESYGGDDTASQSMTRLTTVLFHLVALGLLALLSLIDFGEESLRAVIGKLGVLLLVLALVHGVTIAVLTRMRESQVAETVTAQRHSAAGAAPGVAPAALPTDTQYQEPTRQQMAHGPVVAPVPGQKGRDPKVSPTIENREM
ncbi:hypothetical protein SAMN05421810_10671 [Amycolatopsis arida]|uniref:Uncharacterized protein n=1 Tax=Amycolatopsis arida TaxID=587909 RepID=A0A1I5XI05_9PSEU|nr:hypothetical protein [Amycolatopsis arida]TDX97446.1 hypothetical protein CLV69_102550 [Amycolatopsis arida]SFQ31436.1 hypothetical protein SAMN05421810_10671 [Amycolatopsis arida]